jgi:hypothetical protein
MIDHPRSSVPENQKSFSTSNPPEKTPHQTSPEKPPPPTRVDVTAMVRSLQRSAGVTDCFRTGKAECDDCECDWRSLCLNLSIGTDKRSPIK